jgi:DNA-binding XRE family transcriptional regulator
MLTEKLSETYGSLPESVKPAILALSVLIDRIGSLPKADRDDLFELLQEWRKADSLEEQRSLHRAMEEILAQIPVAVKPMPLSKEAALSQGTQAWASHIGQRMRDLRTKAGMTQKELADKAGLPQSHISRLENAEHSATHLTLGKIAKALGVEAREIDPCLD